MYVYMWQYYMLRRRQRQQKQLPQNSSGEVGQQVSSMKRIMLFFDFIQTSASNATKEIKQIVICTVRIDRAWVGK